MGRLWLALVLVIALVGSAFATTPHVPATPRIKSAYLELGPQHTRDGLYDVAWLRLDADLDRYAATIRITLRTAAGESFTVETTPDALVLIQPRLFARVGTAHLTVTSIGTNALASEPAPIDVVAVHGRPTNCGSGLVFAVLMIFGGGLGVLLMLVLMFKMRATEIERARVRATTEPSPIPNPAAEEYIRSVSLRALLALVVVAAVVVAAIGADVLAPSLFGSPLLIVIAVTAILRVVNAARAVALIHRAGAVAQTRHDQLEVTAGERHVALRSSPKLVERARRNALPKATL